MADTREEHVMTDAADRRDDAQQRKGGFGAFSEAYRDRWAKNHPRPDPAPAASTGAAAAPAAPAAPPDATDAAAPDAVAPDEGAAR
jgi:hypothetical protein